MMISRGLFGWSQELTPVLEVHEPPDTPSPYLDPIAESSAAAASALAEEVEEMEPPPVSVPFSGLFACADRVDWVLMTIGSLAAAAHGTALVVYLHYFAKVIQVLSMESGRSSEQQSERFKELALYIVYIAGGVFAAGWIEVSCWILTGERQTAVIRSKYVQVLLSQDMSFFDTYGNNGDIVSQVLSDVLLIQSALSEKVGNYIHNMATFSSGLVIGFVNCWQIALITLGTGPFIITAGGISNIYLHRLAGNIQDAYAEAASIAEHALSYVRTLYAFTNETSAKDSYSNSLQATLRYGRLFSLVQGLGLGFTYGLAICSCALQLWVGRFLVMRNKAHGGEIITALFAVILSGLGLNQAATNFYSFEQGRIAAYRLFEMISRSSSTTNHDWTTLPSVHGNIEFKNVYFSYLSRPEIPILSGFYLNVPAKKAVALVGRSGSGKTSIIPLMERFYDPALGEILLDGKNIKNLKLEWLRSQIGLLTQEPALLSLSIRDNIAYGRDATLDQIEEAAKIAHAHTFISSLEKGYETQVGRAGLALTEEQKIKISIARAVLLNPSILFIDEVTGGLDFEAERAVHVGLDLLMVGRSSIIISRRLSLTRNADYIAVMEEGQIVEMGSHDELLTLDGLYAELLKYEEAAKLPWRMTVRNYKETATFLTEKDSSTSYSFQEPSSLKMRKSPLLQGVRPTDGSFDPQESPKVRSPPSEKMPENGLPLEADKEPSNRRHPISPLLTSNTKNERSYSLTFSRPHRLQKSPSIQGVGIDRPTHGAFNSQETPEVRSPSSHKMQKSLSLRGVGIYRPTEGALDSQESPKVRSPSFLKMQRSPSIQSVGRDGIYRPTDGAFNSQESPEVLSPSSHKMQKSLSLQRVGVYGPTEGAFDSQESPKVRSPSFLKMQRSPSIQSVGRDGIHRPTDGALNSQESPKVLFPSSPKMKKSLSLHRVGIYTPTDGAFDSQESPKVCSPSSPKMQKSPSLQGVGIYRPTEGAFDSQESPKVCSPTFPKMQRSPSIQSVARDGMYGLTDGAFDSQESPKVHGPSSLKMQNSHSLQRVGIYRPTDGAVDSKESPKVRSSSFPKMQRSPSIQSIGRDGIYRPTDGAFDSQESPKVHRPSSPKMKKSLSIQRVGLFRPTEECSHSQTLSRPHSHSDDSPTKVREVKETQHQKAPSFWRLSELSFAEWLYAVLGSIGAAIFGSFNPLLAYFISLIVTAYYRPDEGHFLRKEVDKWCLIIACMGVVTVVTNFLQHFCFGIVGEKMTERVRNMMFSAMLHNEVGWFDREDNSAYTLSMRLANDATFVRAAFSNRLSVFIQDSAAVFVAVLIGMWLQWRLALVALATLPVLTLSANAQKLWLSGFSRGIQEMHQKASLVLEDAVRDIHTVIAFCAGNKVMEIYRLQLKKIFKKNFLHGMAIGFAFGFSQFLLFACNALLLWYVAISVRDGYMDLPTALKEYIVFSFVTFALVEPFGLAPNILKRRKSLTSVFEIIDRVSQIDSDDNSALKPPNVYGSFELKNVDFFYPSRPDVLVLDNFSLKVKGGQTLAVVGVSGSGKSSIISLIERFYDPVAGQVLLDGLDLKHYNLRWLRNHIGLVQQKPVIFSTTIRENIIYARHNASEAEMKEAARIANAHHFISSLPHGYETYVGMWGADLTPGQKQRIAIARVVLKNAPILLLDEASSSIESESSRVVQEALDTLAMGNKTTILIAHRAAMMRHVDNIVVLNGGRVVEEGTHDSLVAKNGLYVRLMQPHIVKGLRQHRLV